VASPARRFKVRFVVLVIGASALALVAWSQPWVAVSVAQGDAAVTELSITGSTAAPALSALALAGVALAGALAIAGPVIRVVLGLLEVLLGFSVGLASTLAIIDPAAASAAAITKATGIAGTESVLGGVTGAVLTPWPFLALGAGVAMAAAGVGILATGRRWPGAVSRYQAVRFEDVRVEGDDGNAVPGTGETATPGSRPTDAVGPAGGVDAGNDARDDAVITWDGLTRGDDPTARS
jgi:uncharacterized membrane protein (TIGR02234 family)